jgi:hypothetical protein
VSGTVGQWLEKWVPVGLAARGQLAQGLLHAARVPIQRCACVNLIAAVLTDCLAGCLTLEHAGLTESNSESITAFTQKTLVGNVTNRATCVAFAGMWLDSKTWGGPAETG